MLQTAVYPKEVAAMLEVKNLNKHFQGLPVLKDLNLTVGEREITALVGPSGCGKSTLLNLIAGIAREYEGEIINGFDKTGYVFQEDRILPWLTVYDNIRIVRDDKDHARIMQLIEQMHLSGFEDYYPDQLSGGMRQRCGIARAFYYGSRLLLMDEPFKSLDYCLRIEMLSYLKALWEQEQNTVLFVTHDIEEALQIADRILVFSARPSSIIREIKLPRQSGLRDLSDDRLLTERAELIKLIA